MLIQQNADKLGEPPKYSDALTNTSCQVVLKKTA